MARVEESPNKNSSRVERPTVPLKCFKKYIEINSILLFQQFTCMRDCNPDFFWKKTEILEQRGLKEEQKRKTSIRIYRIKDHFSQLFEDDKKLFRMIKTLPSITIYWKWP